MASPPIVLLSDFGHQDSYVGMLKGVIAKIAPEASVIDLTHGLPPYQILSAAFELFRAHEYFPQGSIFVCVVDPGVGSARKPLLANTKDYTFIAPDNGLLTMVLRDVTELSLLELNQEKYQLQNPSHTFHGRDIFAPAAAHLSNGVDLLALGKPVFDYKKLPECFPVLHKTKKGLSATGCILNIDHYGNAITNFSKAWIEKKILKHISSQSKFMNLQLEFPATQRSSLSQWTSHYQAISDKKAHLLFGSSGFLEIACREASAAEKLKLKNGQKVQLTEG